MRACRQFVVVIALLAGLSTAACSGPANKLEQPTGPAFAVGQQEMTDAIGTLRAQAAAAETLVAQAGPIRIEAAINADMRLSAPGADSPVVGHNAFRAELTPERISLTATDRVGLTYAIDHLERLLAEGAGTLSSGRVQSWADHPVRALHLVLRKLTEAEARDLIDQARRARFNTLILQLSNAVRFDNDVITYRDDALSKEAFLRIVAYARSFGIEVVPAVSLLTHQEHFFAGRYPDLMYNKSTYDPRNPATMARVYEYLQEVIDSVGSAALHIGHDEVAGLSERTRKKWLRSGEDALPPEYFLQHVRDVHAFLSAQAVETWMWGDMLIAHDEFPTMHAADFNGAAGYAALRGKLPPDIVICDWHYYQRRGPFPTAEAFAAAGHPVFGTTWKNRRTIAAFSGFVADLPGSRGMIATTWFHVQRKEQDVVTDIIETSGEKFWNAR